MHTNTPIQQLQEKKNQLSAIIQLKFIIANREVERKYSYYLIETTYLRIALGNLGRLLPAK